MTNKRPPIDNDRVSSLRDRGAAVRAFIIDNVDAHPTDIAKITAANFGCSRQAVNKHLQNLVADGSLAEGGRTKSKSYKLAALVKWVKTYPLVPGMSESEVWTADVASALGAIPDNAHRIWQHGFTEMFNNAIDHSEGTHISVGFEKSASETTIRITDNGVGIFRKIQRALGLIDERHAVLELAKGRFTTDPRNHSGEGIFFTSRMFDEFVIMSGGVYFSHAINEKEDWILEAGEMGEGTHVRMTLKNHTSRTAKQVFDEFTTGDDYGFTKTVVPVRLAQYGDDNLISRSQAKRLLARIDRFKLVLLDFRGVAMVGQAFADEIFRVFAANHPEMEIMAINTEIPVRQMISRARAHDAQQPRSDRPTDEGADFRPA